MRRRFSIRNVGLLYAAVTGIIIFLAAGVVFLEVRQAVRAQQAETLLRALDGKTKTLVQSLDVYQRAAARVAADPVVPALLAGENQSAAMKRATATLVDLPDVIALGFITPQGDFLGPGRNIVGPQCREDFRRVASGNAPMLPVHRDGPAGSGHFDIYAPVRDRSGAIRGHVFLAVRLAVLQNLVQAARTGEESQVLRDTRGELLAEASASMPFRRAVHATLPVDATGWTLELTQERPPLNAVERAFVWGTAIAAITCAGLAILLTALGTRQLRRELARVKRVMQQVAEGEAPIFGAGTRLKELQDIMDATENIAGRIHAHQQALTELSLTDELTRLPNRRHFMQELGRGINFARRGMPVCVGMLDLDRFKEVNDRAGHDAGDEVLRIVAQVLTQNLRAADFAARLGGDEFAIVLLGMSHTDARDWFERIRSAFRRQYARARIADVDCTLSGGFAFVDPASDDANAVLTRADAALYEAKREGRDRVIEKIA
jgi:diguanylate cyclase (GGDEF)-like protein